MVQIKSLAWYKVYDIEISTSAILSPSHGKQLKFNKFS